MNCLQCGGLRVNFKMTKCFVFVECDENDPEWQHTPFFCLQTIIMNLNYRP